MTVAGIKMTNVGPISGSTQFSISISDVHITVPLFGDHSDTNNTIFSTYRPDKTHATLTFAHSVGGNEYVSDKNLRLSWENNILSCRLYTYTNGFVFEPFTIPQTNFERSATCLLSFGGYSGKLRYDYKITNDVSIVSPYVVIRGGFIGTARINPPSVTITSPVPNVSTTNAALQITGVNSAFYGTGPTLWRCAAPTDDPSSEPESYTWNTVDDPGDLQANRTVWSTSAQLEPGTNWFWAMTSDSIGNPSAIVTRKFFYSVRSPLTLATNGNGIITGGRGVTNGAMLEVGRGYSVSARAKDTNTVFRDWCDAGSNILSTANTYNFLMQSNAFIAANFIPNPFPAIAGTYSGLFYDRAAWSNFLIAPSNSGYITITVKTDGTYSGTVLFGVQKLPIAGKLQFDMDVDDPDAVNANFTTAANSSLSGHIRFVSDDGGNLLPTPTISMTISNQGLSAMPLTRAKNVVPAGLFNISDGSWTAGPNFARGCGYGSITVTSKGQANFVIHMADGSAPAASFSTPVAEDGSVSYFIPLYYGKGLVMGTLNLTNLYSSNQDGYWMKQPNPRDPYFPEGFVHLMMFSGAAYTPAIGTEFLTQLGVMRISIDSGSGLHTFNAFYVPGSKSFMLVQPTNGVALNLKFNPVTGLVSGSIGVDGVKFNNVNVLITWDPTIVNGHALGYSLGTHETDAIEIIQEWRSLGTYDDGFVLGDESSTNAQLGATSYFSFKNASQLVTLPGPPPPPPPVDALQDIEMSPPTIAIQVVMSRDIQVAPRQHFIITDTFDSMDIQYHGLYPNLPSAGPYTGPINPANFAAPAVTVTPTQRTTQFIAN